ncbi:MAG: hypothetical protein MZW92_58020 [Comamonadaceae bacterium]|nr:hypothetical protein [Comamonadaceae bacterium]
MSDFIVSLLAADARQRGRRRRRPAALARHAHRAGCAWDAAQAAPADRRAAACTRRRWPASRKQLRHRHAKPACRSSQALDAAVAHDGRQRWCIAERIGTHARRHGARRGAVALRRAPPAPSRRSCCR